MNSQTTESIQPRSGTRDLSRLKGVTEKAPKAKPEGSLGTTAKIDGRLRKSAVVQEKRRERRGDLYRHQRHAAKLLNYEERVGLCRYAMQSTGEGVLVVGTTYGSDPAVHASFQGTQTCGSVWHCPVCASRISETRRCEVNTLLAWARAQGHRPVHLTLTTRHGLGDDLGDLLKRLKDAKRRLVQRRGWKNIKHRIVGHVTATEVTGGGPCGWHPHLHIIAIVRGDDPLDLGDDWRGALRGAGLDGNEAAYREQGGEAAGAYVVKGSWGAAEELTLGARKKGSSEGRTPAELLSASCDGGDARAGALWSEYALTFKGSRQLFWSRGLKGLAGVDEVDDETAAGDERQDEQSEPVEIAKISSDDWRGTGRFIGARRRRARILDAAEIEGASGVARVVVDGGGDHEPNAVEMMIEEMDDGTDGGTAEGGTEEARSGRGMDDGDASCRGGSGGRTPTPGGLAARALAAVRSPPDRAAGS